MSSFAKLKAQAIAYSFPITIDCLLTTDGQLCQRNGEIVKELRVDYDVKTGAFGIDESSTHLTAEQLQSQKEMKKYGATVKFGCISGSVPDKTKTCNLGGVGRNGKYFEISYVPQTRQELISTSASGSTASAHLSNSTKTK